MISAHSRSVGSCDRCVWAMVLCEPAELALHIRRLPATTTTQPMQRQRLFCLTWIALISCTLPRGERGSSANGKDPSLLSFFRDRFCRGLSPTTVCDWLFPRKLRDKNISGKRELLAGNRDHLIRPTRCEIANSAPFPAAGVNRTFANPIARCERHNEGAR